MASIITCSFLPSQVPDFLRSSEFFLSLNYAEDEPISLPADCSRFNLMLDTHDFEDGLRSLLATFRFWGVSKLLCIVEFTTFALTVPDRALFRSVIAEFEAELNEMRTLRNILEETSEEQVLCAAMRFGELELVKNMAANNYEFSQECLFAAAHNNHVDCLEFALSQGCLWNPCLSNIAAKQGYVDILRFADDRGFERGFGVCADAARSGQLACLRYAYENGYGWKNKVCPVSNLPTALYARSVGAQWLNYSCCEAAKIGCVDILRHLHEARDYDYPISNKALLVAVWMGHTDCVRYMRHVGVAWTGCECELAAYRDHLDCLKYLHSCGCPWDEWTAWVSAIHDNVDCLQYLHENGCPWDCTTPVGCTHPGSRYSTRACPKCEQHIIMRHAQAVELYRGVIDEIERLGDEWYRHSAGMSQTRPVMKTKPDILSIYRAHCKTCSFGIAALCTYYKAPKCLRYAYSQGCAWPRNPFLLTNSDDCAVRRCIYASCEPWSVLTSANAALCKTADHLQYLHEHGCPWDKRTVMNALRSGSHGVLIKAPGRDYTIRYYACLQYAIKHHCPYDVNELRAAIMKSGQHRNSVTIQELFPDWAVNNKEKKRDISACLQGTNKSCTLNSVLIFVSDIAMRELYSYRVADSCVTLGAVVALSLVKWFDK